jgi:hypothetical protein
MQHFPTDALCFNVPAPGQFEHFPGLFLCQIRPHDPDIPNRVNYGDLILARQHSVDIDFQDFIRFSF